MPESRLHKEVSGGRVHPILSGFAEKDIFTPRGEGLTCCWELVCCGGDISDVVSFLKIQTKRLGQRVTAILRAKVSTWIVDVTDSDVRVTHFRTFAPRAAKVREAMLRSWALRKGRLP